MFPEICSFSLDDELVVVGAIMGSIVVVFSCFAASRHTHYAEQHLDEHHWASNPGRHIFSEILCKCIRGNTGLGYTPTGRSIWWHGYRYLFAIFLLSCPLAFSMLFVVRHCA